MKQLDPSVDDAKSSFFILMKCMEYIKDSDFVIEDDTRVARIVSLAQLFCDKMIFSGK